MASARYTLNIKPEDLKPDEPQQPMTAKQKRENFWFYYKWYILFGAIVVFLIGMFVYDIVTKEIPDLEIAVVTAKPLPSTLMISIADQLGANGMTEDLNKDGKVLIQLNQYNISTDETKQPDPVTQMAGTVKLTADIQAGISTVFLTDDLESLQALTGIFSAEEGAVAVDWQEAEGMKDLNLVVEDLLSDQLLDFTQTMQNFQVVRRGYIQNEKKSVLERAKQGDKLYEKLTGVPSRW